MQVLGLSSSFRRQAEAFSCSQRDCCDPSPRPFKAICDNGGEGGAGRNVGQKWRLEIGLSVADFNDAFFEIAKRGFFIRRPAGEQGIVVVKGFSFQIVIR